MARANEIQLSLKAASALFLLLLCGPDTAAFGGTGGGSAEYPQVYKSSHLLGQGGAGGVAEPRDEESLFFNPAGLNVRSDEDEAGFKRNVILADPMVEVSRSTIKLAQDVKSGSSPTTDIVANERGKPQHVGAYNFTGILLPNFAFGAFEEASSTALFSKSQQYRGVEALSLDAEAGKGLIAGCSEQLAQHLSLGLSVMYLDRQEIHTQESVVDAALQAYNKKPLFNQHDMTEEGRGVGATVGMLWRRKDIAAAPSLALTVANVSDTAMDSSENKGIVRNIKQTVNLGGAISPFGTPWMRAYGDFDDVLGAVETDVIKRTHFGTTLKLGRVFSLSSGLNQGYPAVGVSADSHLLRIEAGAYSEEVGEWAGRRQDSRIYTKLTLGF